MEKRRGKRTDALPTDKVFTRKEYIEREAARRSTSMFFTMSMCASEDECRVMNRAIRIVEKRIDAIPSADVVPVRHGRWIDMGDFISCSECNATRMKEFLCDYGVARRLDVRTKYCPNCGARMDGDGDGV